MPSQSLSVSEDIPTDLHEDVKAVYHLAQHDMLPITLWSCSQGEEELAARGTP